jgi:hypothetical protein
MKNGETANGGEGFHFHGDMRKLADFTAGIRLESRTDSVTVFGSGSAARGQGQKLGERFSRGNPL